MPNKRRISCALQVPISSQAAARFDLDDEIDMTTSFVRDPEGNFFALNGRQYIATPSGWGSLAGFALGQLFPEMRGFKSGATMFAFALPEDR